VCDQETSKTRRLKPATGLWKYNHNGLQRQENKQQTTVVFCSNHSDSYILLLTEGTAGNWWLWEKNSSNGKTLKGVSKKGVYFMFK
jgi:N-acetyl-beta-hexosaminidase